MIDTELFHLIGHEFSTFIISDAFDCSTKVILSIGFELLECCEGIRLLLKTNSIFESTVVIKKDSPVLITSK
jgi:hypothetical protein